MSSGAYFCRNCKLPLVIDESLDELSHAQQHLLTLNYGEKPQSTILIKGGKNVKNSNKIKENLENDKRMYNEYPKIPDIQVKMFQQALTAIQDKTISRTDTGIEYEETNNINNAEHPVNNFKSNDMNENDDKDSESSFVYLHDKAQTNDDVYSDTNDSSLNISNIKAFNDEEIKGVVEKKTDISERIESLETIFNIISSKYEIDYPVCSDCATTLINRMKTQYDSLNKTKEIYMQFLRKLTTQNGPNIQKTEKALSDLDAVKHKMDDTMKRLSEEEERHMKLNKELYELENEIQNLKIEENELCQAKSKKEIEFENNLQSLNIVKNEYYQNLNFLDSLRKTNVFNNFFDISNDGDFGTINGLRLGCLDNIKVTWHEINAALGHLVLLLSTCLNILSLDLKGYKLIPMGSTSKIEKYEADSSGKISKSIIQLYCTGEFSIGGFFSHNNLDTGMVCLVDVLNQIAAYIKKLDTSCEIPYIMKDDKVAGYCIRASRSGWKNWTNGCHFLLVNVKWILTFCVAHYEERTCGE